MAATAYTETAVRGNTIRITRLDNCGNAVSGSGSSLVTKGFATLKATKNFDKGTEIKIRNANDVIGAYVKGVVTLLDFDYELDWSIPDLGAIQVATGDPAVVDASGLVAGWIEEALQPLAAWIAIEVWTNIANQQCAGTATLYGYTLYPFLENNVFDMADIASKDIMFSLKGNTRQGNNWGRGPYDVVNSAVLPTVTPAWLSAALPASAHRYRTITSIAPPTQPAFAGMQTLTPVSS